MAIIKCKMCGGDLNLVAGASTAECEYCGSVQTVPKVDDEKKLTLFARANRLRVACEFDKATGIYESIVADFPEEAEAYWGLVLCKYGIEYVDDPATGKKIPTCHRSSFDSIMEDSDFEQALENADAVARKVYREEAKTIEEIRKGIIAVSNNEQPYDIFICYKETAENGDRTLDSVLAQDVYDALTGKGYRVFFSRITLEDKLGMEYEPYIFAALNSAKIMLTFGTDYEYFNAVWVKNEWSRFLKLMAKDKEKHLIPCFKGIDAYDMPKEFARLQAQDLGKVGAIQDLLRGIEKILPRQTETVKETVVVQQPIIQQASGINVSALLKRGNMALEDHEWKKAEEFFNEALNIDAECGAAYLGLALSGMHLSSARDLVFERYNEKNYQRAKQYADPALLAELTAYENELASLDRAKEEQEAARLHAEKLERQARIPEMTEKRAKIAAVQNLIHGCNGCLGDGCVAVAVDGSLVSDSYEDDCNDVFIAASDIGYTGWLGLRPDGTVLFKTWGDDTEYGKDQFNVSNWKDIVAIASDRTESDCTVGIGLKSDGTVVCAGNFDQETQAELMGWRNIVAISVCEGIVIGLKSDRTVVCASFDDSDEKVVSNISKWEGIVAIDHSWRYAMGLKNDGTVVLEEIIVRDDFLDYLKVNVDHWDDIVAIAAGGYSVYGLKSDGTIVIEHGNKPSAASHDEPRKWTDIVAISASDCGLYGVKSNGTVVSTDKRYAYRPRNWRLFSNINNIEQERAIGMERRRNEIKQRKEYERNQINWRNSGLCQHCGGELKGLFSKKCVSCGKLKDY